MDGMGWWWCTSEDQVLNYPVDPLTLEGKLDQVLSARESVVIVHDILEDRLAPVDIHRGGVDTPDDDVTLSVDVRIAGNGLDTLGNTGKTETDREKVDLSEEVGDVTNSVGHPGDERSRSVTVTAVGVSRLSGRGSNLLSLVSHDGVTRTLVEGEAASGLGFSTEPVVTGGLVGIDNNFVSLTDVDQDRVHEDGLGGDEVGSDNLKLMSVNGYTDSVVDRHVDETEKVLLALLDLKVEVLARGTGRVHVGTVDQDVVGSRSGSRRPGVKTSEDSLIGVLGRHVEPILKRQWAQVYVPVVRGRTVNDDRTDESITILSGMVRVVP